jgi:hypothetical protein
MLGISFESVLFFSSTTKNGSFTHSFIQKYGLVEQDQKHWAA